MLRSMGDRLRLAAILIIAVAVAACVPMERPRLGEGPPPIPVKKIKTLGAAPVKGAAVRIAFATVTGTPAQMRFTLEDSLKSYAATRNLVVVPPDDPSATYYVKGYLSAIGDTSGTLLVYVWDVYDRGGTALHRISGQQTGGGSEADPWVGVGSGEIDAAARETIDKIADWVRG